MKAIYFVLSGIFFLLIAESIKSDNILFLALPLYSHIHPMTFLAKELHKKGHNSYFFVPEELSKILKASEGVHFLRRKEIIQMPEFSRVSMNHFSQDGTLKFRDLQKIMWEICDGLLFDETWFELLKSFNASLIVVNNIYMNNCLTIIPYKLSLPFILFGAMVAPSIQRTPWVYPAFPFILSPFPERMTFLERLQNTYIHILNYISAPIGAPAKSVMTYAPDKPDILFEELLRKAALHIVETDVLIDYAMPTMPNVEHLGGMGAQPAEPLEGDLLKFVNSSERGIIVVSFGSVVNVLPEEHLIKMGKAFKQIKYDVVWKWSDTSYSSPNVFITKWMPQNDLLGHPKTSLFITHCGNGGQFESLYHAVPMLGFPVFFDQPHNGRRMEDKGYGISMDMFNYSLEDLVANINEIIENPKYKYNIQMASDIFKSRPENPSVRGARLVNDVIKHGGGFLRSYSQDMPLYQYFMLDILVFVLSSAVIGILIAAFIFRKCLFFFRRTKTKND